VTLKSSLVKFLLLFGWIDENGPASHRIHIDEFSAKIDEDQTGLKFFFVTCDGEFIQIKFGGIVFALGLRGLNQDG
jgi:hypothetical protein